MHYKPVNYLIIILVLVATSVQLTGCNSIESTEKTVLFAYVGANIKEPVVKLVEEYEKSTGHQVKMTFNNSGALLNQLETTKRGDIFIPGSITYINNAQKKGHIDSYVGPIAYHTPVIVVPKGNPEKIKDINDLARPGVDLVLPDREATALGRATFKMFTALGIDGQIEKNILTVVETVPKVATTIIMGQGDAGIAEYSNFYKNRDKLDLVEIDPTINTPEEISCALLTYSDKPELATDFINFMRTNGPAVFAKYGFRTEQQ